jgi:hypothetical protein
VISSRHCGVTIVTIIRARTACVRRPGALERLYGQREDITDAALCLYHARRARIGFQLAAQPQDLHVNASVEDVFVHASRLEQLLACERPLGSLEERDQQGIFAFRQRNRRSIRTQQAATIEFKLPLAEFVSTPLWLSPPRVSPQLVPPQDSANAGEQFSETERLGHVVVRTELEANYAVDFFEPVAGGDNDGHIRAGSNLSEYIQPIFSSQPQVKNNQVRFASRTKSIQLLPAGRGTGRHVVLLEVTGDHPPRGWVIIDNEYVVRFAAVVGIESAIHIAQGPS